MSVLELIRRILLCLLACIELTAAQNITVYALFGTGDGPASVLAADPSDATYWVTYTNMCRSGPCSPLTIYTNIIIQGASTAALTNFGDGKNSQTFECAVTTSLMTGICTGIQTWSGTTNTYFTAMGTDYYRWQPLIVTAGMDKLSVVTVPTANGTAWYITTLSSIITFPAASTPSLTTTPASSTQSSTPSTSSPLSSTPLATTPSATGTPTNSGATSTVSQRSTAFTGAAAGCQAEYIHYALAGLAGVLVVN